ncbi:MAG: alpha/beta hydrolase [Clostridia bacterium]|nr:alpha/beta hydrolase [Clostridia bacterium]
MLMISAALLVCVSILVGVLLVCSPGKPEPFLDDNGRPVEGSISEKLHININGMEQGMFIKSKNNANPVLLFVHGGPGMPEYAFEEVYPTGLENYFTVCWWEQRGAGLSYNAGISADSVTLEQSVSDTLAVTDYLRERFGQEKIYLMAHSGGTYTGISAAAKAPERYKAYIGIGQLSQSLESERLAYEYMLEQYRASGNTRMVRRLEKYPPSTFKSYTELHPYVSSVLRDEAMHDLGIGTTRNMKSLIRGIVLPIFQCREYTLGEKINIWRGKALLGKSRLREQNYSTDLTSAVQKLDIPVYFFSGAYDYTVNYSLAKKYLNHMKAPIKGFYTFDESAHSPLFEEPERMQQILQEDVMAGVNNLADAQ